jgi:hypothetical protein
MPDYTESKATTQYLKNYAEPEVRLVPNTPAYRHCLVIPAFNERWDSLQNVWQHIEDDFLLILVVNAPESHEATLKLLEDIRLRAAPVDSKSENRRCIYLPGHPDILLVDRCTQGNTIEPHQGVGLARKIGADIALQLHTDGKLKRARISITDADAILPADYFESGLNHAEAALVFPFHHITDNHGDKLTQAIPNKSKIALSLYETSILYYASGLSWAGSPYGFPALGSCMAISPRHYAQVRGYPKRPAAEDFYLLNKLAKTGEIIKADSKPILLSGRLSERVPFGTGPGVRKILALENPMEDYAYYHPEIFQRLQEFLNLLSTYWDSPNEFSNSSRETLNYWKANSLDETFNRHKSRQSQKPVFEKFIHDWFDGFRTLKFVHFMRDHHFPSVPLSGIGEARFVDSDLINDLPALRDRFNRLLFK